MPDPFVVCDLVESWCQCLLALGHAGDHVCDCGGSWTYGEAGEFQPVRLPWTATPRDGPPTDPRTAGPVS